jgi:hypothetical protein
MSIFTLGAIGIRERLPVYLFDSTWGGTLIMPGTGDVAATALEEALL